MCVEDFSVIERFLLLLLRALYPISFLGFLVYFFWHLVTTFRAETMKEPRLRPSLRILSVYLLHFVFILFSIDPSFLTGMAKTKDSEAKWNLCAIFIMQVSYFGEYHRYGDRFDLINWSPEGRNLYCYYLGQDIILNRKGEQPFCPRLSEWPFSVRPGVSDKSFTAMAVGNIDNDPVVDVLYINDKKELKRGIKDIRNAYYTPEFKIIAPEYEKPIGGPLRTGIIWRRHKDFQDLFRFIALVLGIVIPYFAYRDYKRVNRVWVEIRASKPEK